MADGYTVTGLTQTQRIGTSGNLVEWIEATVELADGAGILTVAVPYTDTWDTELEAAIQDQAGKASGILAL